MVTVAPSEPATGAVKTTSGVGASGAKLPELASISASALAAARVACLGSHDTTNVVTGPVPPLSIASAPSAPVNLATQHFPEPSSSSESSRPSSAARQTLSEEEDEGFNEEASSTSSSIVSSVRHEFEQGGGNSPESTTEKPNKTVCNLDRSKKLSLAPVSFTVNVISTTARTHHHHHHLHVHQHSSHSLRVLPSIAKASSSCSCSSVTCEHQKQSPAVKMNSSNAEVAIQEIGHKTSMQLSNNFDISRLKSITMGGFIKGSTGSVRGKRNNVRQSISNYTKMVQLVNTEKGQLTRDYQAEEANKCVLYVTSLGIIRKTFDESKALKAILNNHFINYEERDIFINIDFKQELKERLSEVKVPALFVKGHLLGFYLEIEKMNESGKLATSLACFKLDLTNGEINCGKMEETESSLSTISSSSSASASSTVALVKRRFGECARCGSRRFINCDKCNGSCKTFVHHFPHTSITLKCSVCKRQGLVRCPECNPAQEHMPSVPSQIAN